MSGGYVSVVLDSAQQKEIQEVLKKADIDPVKDMHCTLMYDESNPKIDYNTNSKQVYKAEITGVEKLGEAIALVLKCTALERRHKELRDLGFSHSYEDFLCHMSVVYDPESTDLDVVELIHKLDVFPKVLKFSSEKNEDLED